MANPAWYNDNQFRDYPFITRVEPLAETTDFGDEPLFHLPHSAILDFGAIMEIDAEFSEASGHIIYLHSVARFSDIFTFKLRTTAAGAANYEMVFHRDLTSPEFLISWESASTIDPESPSPFTCPNLSRWSGFVVTGSMDELAGLLTNGTTLTAVPGLWQIEPARVQSLARSYLRSVSLANAARLHATPQVGCSLSSSEAANQPAIANTLCMAGNLGWKEGFNCTIRQDNNNNAIIIGAGVGIGDGVPCAEIPLYDGEHPPADSPFLSGGPACNEVIKSINGISGTDINFVAGPGFRIQPDTVNPHKLVIDRSLDVFIPETNSSLSGSEEFDVACLGLSSTDSFKVTLLEGLLTSTVINDVLELTCNYDAGLSLSGNKTWVSEMVVTSYWNDGAFCGFRWRAKITCDEDGLRVSIVGYPLADNSPCRTCTAIITAPLTLPLGPTTLVLDCSANSSDCGCFDIGIVTSVQVEQL